MEGILCDERKANKPDSTLRGFFCWWFFWHVGGVFLLVSWGFFLVYLNMKINIAIIPKLLLHMLFFPSSKYHHSNVQLPLTSHFNCFQQPSVITPRQ